MGKINDGWRDGPARRKLAPGETMDITVGDRQLRIRRTNREYIHDLCDAYNEARDRPDVEWFVAGDTLMLGTPEFAITARARALDRAAENDRERWKAMQNAPRDYF